VSRNLQLGNSHLKSCRNLELHFRLGFKKHIVVESSFTPLSLIFRPSKAIYPSGLVIDECLFLASAPLAPIFAEAHPREFELV